MAIGRRAPQDLRDRVGFARVDGLEHDLRLAGLDARTYPMLVDDVEVRQQKPLVGRLPPEITRPHEKAGADTSAEAPANGSDRKRAIETSFPPLVGLRPFSAEHRFELCFLGRRLLPQPLQLLRRDFNASATKFHQTRAEDVNERAAAIVPLLEVPDLRELPECARDVESFRAWGRHVVPDVAFDYVPVVQTERC